MGQHDTDNTPVLLLGASEWGLPVNPREMTELGLVWRVCGASSHLSV